MKPVGYLTKYKTGLEGERGQYYDYVTARNGLFIEAEGPFMAARVPVALATVNGLERVDPKVVLRHGLIPAHLFELALATMQIDLTKEKYVAITWDNGYHLAVPEQQTSGASVKYETVPNTVLALHSHGRMRAFFSGVDNHDEQGFGLFGVVGTVGGYEDPAKATSHDEEMDILMSNATALRLRAGVYGNFWDLSWDEVFEGQPSTEYFVFGKDEDPVPVDLVADMAAEETEAEEKEEQANYELQSGQPPHGSGERDHRGWLRWNRWFRGRGLMPSIGK